MIFPEIIWFMFLFCNFNTSSNDFIIMECWAIFGSKLAVTGSLMRVGLGIYLNDFSLKIKVSKFG